MKDVVHGAGDFNEARDVLLDEVEARVREQVANVGLDAGDQIVETENLPIALD